MLPVEVFVTRINMESSDQRSLGADWGIKMKSERVISTDQDIFSDTNEAW